MKSENIKIGHIYYVDFEPTRPNEFNKKHLAVVLKKNADKITFIAIPLTSSNKGKGINKMSLGCLECLPERLRDKETFAVYDQVRTLHSSRFETIRDDGLVIDVMLDEENLKLLYKAVIKDLLFDFQDKKDVFLEEIAKEYKTDVSEEIEDNTKLDKK